MTAALTEHTDPNLPRVVADPATELLELQAAVDQLTKPELVNLDRIDGDDDDGSTLENLRHDYRAARSKAGDETRRDVERAAHSRRARRLAQQIIATVRNRVELPPLLAQIREAVESSTSSGQLGSSTHPAPIGLAAAGLLGEIESVVGRGPDPTLISQVRRWSAVAGGWRTTQPHRLQEANRLAQDWVTAARQLINPDRRYRPVRDAACPVCKRSHTWLTVEGERRREPALIIDSHTGVTTCRVCDERWPLEMGQWLVELLTEQRAERRARRP